MSLVKLRDPAMDFRKMFHVTPGQQAQLPIAPAVQVTRHPKIMRVEEKQRAKRQVKSPQRQLVHRQRDVNRLIPSQRGFGGGTARFGNDFVMEGRLHKHPGF